MPRLETMEIDRRGTSREGKREAKPREDGMRTGTREYGRRPEASRAEPREDASRTGINVNLMGGVRGSLTVPTFTPWRIFPSSKEENNQ